MLEIRSEGSTTECQIDKTWGAYRKQCNKIITFRKQSKRHYLMDKCGGKYTNIKDFCKIVKALILFGYCSEVI